MILSTGNKHVECCCCVSFMNLNWTPVSHDWGLISLGVSERGDPIPLSHAHHVISIRAVIGLCESYIVRESLRGVTLLFTVYRASCLSCVS